VDLKGIFLMEGKEREDRVRRRGKGFFFIFKHLLAPKRSWKFFMEALEKSWIFCQ